ncbi:MAG: hypothetical protein HY233_10085, partial [Acidobacteriales bacterium]|nr:hypothetical protein [Terriglobales bacterium]
MPVRPAAAPKPPADRASLWNAPVKYVKGVGPKRAEFLATQGVISVADLLLTLPRRYLDRSNLVSIGSLIPDQTITVVGRIIASGLLRGRKTRFEAVLDDGTGRVTLLWFAGWRYLQEVIKKGVLLAVSGTTTWFDGIQLVHPECEFLEDRDIEDLTHTGRVIPLYPSGEAWRVAGLESRNLRRIIKPLIDGSSGAWPDYQDKRTLGQRGLMSLDEALAQAHFPDDLAKAEAARARLAFDELFFLELTLAQNRAAIDRRHDGRACA